MDARNAVQGTDHRLTGLDASPQDHVASPLICPGDGSIGGP